MESMTTQSGKPKHVKPNNKNQQDEEEERGKFSTISILT